MKTVLLDMDGVLVDVRGSFRRAIVETVQEFTGVAPTHDLIQAKKDGGGFNNDWILSHALVREAGFDVPFETVKASFQQRYRGNDFDGLIAKEPTAVRTETLELLAERYKLGLVSGRPEADAEWTLRKHGWDRLIKVVVGMDQQAGREKPDPFGLVLALEQLGTDASDAVYVGDMVDDQKAARAAGMTAVGVIPPGMDVVSHGRVLVDAGASAVLSATDDVPSLLTVIWPEHQ